MSVPSFLAISSDVHTAQDTGIPVVALESAVITHGLPYPENLNLALEMERIVRESGAIPATIGLIDGQIRIGLTRGQLEILATHASPRKISRRDFGIALARQETGGTTVAGTLFAAHKANIRVFATGGIGGVHRHAPFDISADLHELSSSPLVVVCAGAKAILDLPATLEVLETAGVPVIGYQTDEFPAFYSRTSGLKVNVRCETTAEVAAIARAHWHAGLHSAILVANPPQIADEIPQSEIEDLIEQAVAQAERHGIHGAAVTPYLLERVNQLTGGRSLQTNLALLHNNARLAAQIALALQESQGLVSI
jgi:pseudouridylate synthase